MEDNVLTSGDASLTRRDVRWLDHLILIALLSVAVGQPKPNRHESYRRYQQYENGSINGALALFASSRSIAIAHCAALAKHRCGPKAQQQSHCHQT